MTDAELKSLVEKLITTVHQSHAETMARFDRIESDVAELKASMLHSDHRVSLLEVRLDGCGRSLAMERRRLDDQARFLAAVILARTATAPHSRL